MNVVSAMTQLAVARPKPGADPDSVSAWYEAKARLHEHLASIGGPDSAREIALCATARRRAQLQRRQD
ncbi:hypothetical protein HUN08_17540 [Gordonia sp. X0973]|uniref:hypothetical protein n=1 Tax=Gordonia sp. X0973 TaxID=2742602 RepID=UPI000F51BCD3|nr:hypothetical protein [Gordonia sp. X0973]QKT08809.1 hypothetical protein HUN08_17540 [Gordonia sp. X0973]